MAPEAPAEVSILNADKRVVAGSGRTTFAAQLNVGSDGPGEILLSGGITNPLGALGEHRSSASSAPTSEYRDTNQIPSRGAP